MFEKGDLVIYGTEGVCEISDISTQSFQGINIAKTYYILEPKENKSSKLFVPVDNEVLCNRIKKLLNYEELNALVRGEDCHIEWITDNKLRNKYYKDIINSYNRQEIISLVKFISEVKNGKNSDVKKIYTMDEDFFKKMLQILYMEFSYVLDITQDQVLPYIFGEIDCKRKDS